MANREDYAEEQHSRRKEQQEQGSGVGACLALEEKQGSR